MQKCTLGSLSVDGERRLGFSSNVVLRCISCNNTWEINTAGEKKRRAADVDINKSVVWGTLSSGGTFSHRRNCLLL